MATAPLSAVSLSWHGVDLHWAYGELLSGIRRRTRCAHRAFDVLHDALVRFALVSRRMPVVQPQAYLRRVVDTVLADHFRDAQRWEPLTLEESGEDRNDAESAHWRASFDTPTCPSAEQLAELNQRLRHLQEIFDTMPARRGEVLWMFRVEGYRQVEIARRLGISQTMVERHIARALVDLHTALAVTA